MQDRLLRGGILLVQHEHKISVNNSLVFVLILAEFKRSIIADRIDCTKD